MIYQPDRFKRYLEHSFTYEAGLRRNFSRYATRPALVDPDAGRSWTYAQFGADAARLAVGLAGLGVGRGDRVVFQLFNGSEFALLYAACHRLGAIGVPINYRLAPGETAYILRDSRPAVFIADAELIEAAGQAAKLTGRKQRLVIVYSNMEADASLPEGMTAFSDLFASKLMAPELPADFSTYEETTRLYTSGTTGQPKGVSLPSIVEIFSAHDVAMHFPLTPDDRTLNMTPWFHRGGLHSGGPTPAFYVGASVVPMRSFDAPTVLDWTQEHGITFLIGAPTTLELLADEQEERPRNLSSLRGIVTMGAPLDRSAALRYQNVLSPWLFNGYGTTEMFWNTFLRPEDLPERAGSAGQACTDDDVAVVKLLPERRARPEEHAAQDQTEVGEVIMRSPKSGFSYANLPDQNEEKFHDGWLYPGDLATWDREGFITIVGRKDDMIVSGGENVHPVQVEAVLAEHPRVSDALVVGAPGGRWGQRVVAYIIPTTLAPTPEELDEYCRSHTDLASYKRPRAYRMVSEFPRTATGKKKHFEMAQQAERDSHLGLLEASSTSTDRS